MHLHSLSLVVAFSSPQPPLALSAASPTARLIAEDCRFTASPYTCGPLRSNVRPVRWQPWLVERRVHFDDDYENNNIKNKDDGEGQACRNTRESALSAEQVFAWWMRRPQAAGNTGMPISLTLTQRALAPYRVFPSVAPQSRHLQLDLLRSLTVTCFDTEDLLWLSACPLLEELSLVQAYVHGRDYTPIGALCHLQCLVLDDSNVDCIEWIPACAALLDVSLVNVHVSLLRPLGQLRALAHLKVSRVREGDLTFLGGGGGGGGDGAPIQGIQTLSVANFSAKALEPICYLHQLRVLHLTDARKVSLSCLSDCHGLEELTLNDVHTDVRTLGPQLLWYLRVVHMASSPYCSSSSSSSPTDGGEAYSWLSMCASLEDFRMNDDHNNNTTTFLFAPTR